MSSTWFETVAVARVARETTAEVGLRRTDRRIRKGLSSPTTLSRSTTRTLATSPGSRASAISPPPSWANRCPCRSHLAHGRPGGTSPRRSRGREGSQEPWIAMGLSSFSSKSCEEVCAVNSQVLFQMYWSGDATPCSNVSREPKLRAPRAYPYPGLVLRQWSRLGSPGSPRRLISNRRSN